MVTVTPLSMPLAPRTSRRRVFWPLSRTLDQSGYTTKSEAVKLPMV